jgi:pilus assembly protein CpaD
MSKYLALVLLASTVAACNTTGTAQPFADPARGLEPVNVPVVTRMDYAFDAAAPDGTLGYAEQARLDAWYKSLGLSYGDVVFVDGPYAADARRDVAKVTGKYGLLLSEGSPITAGAVPPGTVRVVVSRTRATVPGCPNWDRPASPDHQNRTMSNFACAISSNMAAMVANPGDLVHGREGEALVDGLTASKAIQSYRTAKPTGDKGLQDINTKKD